MEMKYLAEDFFRLFGKCLENGSSFIVEGQKDKRALQHLNVPAGRVLVLNRKPLFAVAEEAAKTSSSVVILTDLDSEGRLLFGKIRTFLAHLGVKVDDSLRNFLFRRTRLRQIEGLPGLLFKQRNSTPPPP